MFTQKRGKGRSSSNSSNINNTHTVRNYKTFDKATSEVAEAQYLAPVTSSHHTYLKVRNNSSQRFPCPASVIVYVVSICQEVE